MSGNAEIRALPTGYNEFDVGLQPYEPPPPTPEPQTQQGRESFRWTIHPKRRANAVMDRKRKATPFRRLSLNTDFRAWRRIVDYGKKIVLKLLRCEMTYGEIEATGLTYAQMEATGMTYGELATCDPILT